MKERMERLDKYLKYKGLSDNYITGKCGLAKGLLSRARNGKTDIGLQAVDKITTFCTDLNRGWLLGGNGEMLSPSPQNIVENVGSVGGSINQTAGGNEVINLRLENERLRATLESYRERINEQKEQIKDLLNLLKPN